VVWRNIRVGVYDLYRSRRFPNPVSARPSLLPLFTRLRRRGWSTKFGGRLRPGTATNPGPCKTGQELQKRGGSSASGWDSIGPGREELGLRCRLMDR